MHGQIPVLLQIQRHGMIMEMPIMNRIVPRIRTIAL